MSTAGPVEHRIAPQVAARVVGLVVVGIALLVFATTALVAVLDLHTAVLLVPAVLGLLVLSGLAITVTRRGWVVRFTDEGYVVQWVRGAGTTTARWTDVEDAVTSTVAGARVVVIRLRSGGSTTIPVDVLATDADEFVRDLRRHLQDGQGLRPWDGTDSPEPETG